MKKIFALTFAAMIILTCFTACKPKLKNGKILTNAAGENIAAVTQADGGLTRDEAGNIIVLVTDEDGRNVKGDNGEYETKAVALEHALVVGNTIECADFALTIPDGWGNKKSFNQIVIEKENSADVLSVSNERGASLAETLKNVNIIFETMKEQHSSAVIQNTTVEVLGKSANFMSGYVADTGAGKSAYLGYIIFTNENSVYTLNLISDRNMSENLDEYLDIFNTIQYR